jgi:hypothetical protein
MNPLEADECIGCGHPFKRMDATSVTPKPVGILAEGERYVVIVPKNTQYPTLEPVVARFQMASQSQKAVLVPLYHAEVPEFDQNDTNQWLGAAHIPLEGSFLPAGTPVDVSVSIDRDGCLEIEATVQDGSGRARRVYIDPKVSQRSAAETQLATSAQDEPAAGALPEWEARLQWSLAQGEVALADYEWMFRDHAAIPRLEGLVKQGQAAKEGHDEENGRRLQREIEAVLEAQHPNLVFLLDAEMCCRFLNMEPAMRSQVRTVIREVGDLIRTTGRQQELDRKAKELNDLLKTCLDAVAATGADQGAYLRGMQR